MHVSVLL